jgi:hypothetical protein
MEVFENKVLKKGLDKRGGGGIKLRNEKLCDPNSPNIIRVVKSRRMRLVGHVARRERGEICIGFCSEDLKEMDHLEDLGVDGRLIIKFIFKK